MAAKWRGLSRRRHVPDDLNMQTSLARQRQFAAATADTLAGVPA